MKNPAISKTEILIDEQGNRSYKKVCPRCRKVFITTKCQQVYCSEACKEAYNKSRKVKSRSGKRYVRKHNVSRAIEAAGRNLSRRLAMLALKPVDYMTGKKFDSWAFVQIHHIDLCPQNCSLSNLAVLTPQSHDSLHKQLKEKFGKDVEDKLYQFGRGIYNFASQKEYNDFLSFRDEVIAFERSLFKVDFGQEIPEFKEK